MMEIKAGQMLGPYRILGLVGQGGMATVYKAYHAATDRAVAVKVLPSQFAESPEFAERFRHEARTVANLEHPHILPVFDFGEHQGTTYFVMRYLDTGTLKSRLAAGRLSLAQVDHLIGQIAGALGYAHSRGVIHRDVKPANIMVDTRGDAFLTDFGIAKLMESTVQLTATGAVTGTPAYMSPEQAQGEKLDQRSDIYSLGIVLYEMITGRVPFEAETPMAVMLKQLNAPLPPPTQVKPDLSPEIERVLLKALAKERADRFATCADFLAAWKRAVGSTTVREVPSGGTLPTLRAAEGPQRPGSRMWILAGIAAVAGLAFCGLVVVSLGALGILRGAQGGAATPAETAALVQPTATGPGAPKPTTAGPAALATAPPVTVETGTLATALNLSENDGRSLGPHAGFDGQGNLHVVWADSTFKGGDDVLHRQRLPDGSWSETENLTTPFDFLAAEFSLSLDRHPDGRLCAFWYGSSGSDPSGLYMTCWGTQADPTPQRIDFTRNLSFVVSPAFDRDGAVRAAYADRSNRAFFGDVLLSDTSPVYDKIQLAIDTTGGYHVLWRPSGSERLEYHYSADGGQTWQMLEQLADSKFGPITFDMAADDKGRVHVTWSAVDVYYRSWSAAGGWGPTQAVAEDAGFPSIAVDSIGLAHIAWQGNEGVGYVRQEADGSWGAPRQVPYPEGWKRGSGVPGIAVDPVGVARLVWSAYKGVPDATDIFYTMVVP